jgi:hypothetical protein
MAHVWQEQKVTASTQGSSALGGTVRQHNFPYTPQHMTWGFFSQRNS